MCQQEPYALVALLMFTIALHQQVLGTARLHFLTRYQQTLENLIILVIFLYKAKSFLKTKAQDRLDYS